MKKLNRKKFFSYVTSGVAFTALSSLLPTKFLNSVKKASERKISIKIHPEAIKRNKV